MGSRSSQVKKSKQRAIAGTAEVSRRSSVSNAPKTAVFSLEPWDKYSAVMLCILLGALVFMQGGYYASTTLIIGALGCAALVPLLVKRRPGSCASAAVLAGIGVLTFTSFFVNERGISSLAYGFSWFSLAAFALFPAMMSATARRWVLRLLTWVAVASAAIGVLVFSGALLVEGAVTAGRLHFPFEYANASGIWFASWYVYVLSTSGAGRPLHPTACLLIIGLLLTMSVGAICCWIGGCAACCLWCDKCSRVPRIRIMLIDVLLGVCAFLLCRTFPPFAPLWALLALTIRWRCESFLASVEVPTRRFRALRVVGVGVVIIALVLIAAIVVSPRFEEALGTFTERLIQMNDAAVLLVGTPVWGVGPDGWEDAYRFIQSESYTAATVHCSYLQIALDAGLPALIVLLGFVLWSWLKLVQQRSRGVAVAAAVMVLHAAFDFDLHFSALFTLLIVFLSLGLPPGSSRRTALEMRTMHESRGGEAAARPRSRQGALLPMGITVLALMTSACGLGAEYVMASVREAAAEGDVSKVESALQLPGTAHDEDLETLSMEALLHAGAFDQVAWYADCDRVDNAEQALLAATAMIMLDKEEEAERVLDMEIMREPFHDDLRAAKRELMRGRRVT